MNITCVYLTILTLISTNNDCNLDWTYGLTSKHFSQSVSHYKLSSSNVNIILIPWIANYFTSLLLSPPIVHPCHSVPCPSTMACTSFHTPSTILFSNFLLLFHLMSRPFKCPTYFFEYHTPKLRPLPTAAFFLYDSYSNPNILTTSNHYRQLVLDSDGLVTML